MAIMLPTTSTKESTETLPSVSKQRKRLLAASIFVFGLLVFFSVASFAERTADGVELGEQELKVQVVKANNSTQTPSTERATDNVALGEPDKEHDVQVVETNDSSQDSCAETCNTRAEARKNKFHGDLMSREDLLRITKEAKADLLNKLKLDYGTYFEDIFIGPGKSFTPITPDGVSRERLKRKLMIKVLSMQTMLQKSDSNVNGCDCVHGGSRVNAGDRAVKDDGQDLGDTYARYVWATGGHSAAAGHGNLYNESYTAYLTQDIVPVFAAIGIEFEGRNYAMGGTSSHPEISMCWEQIFGTDVDFFSWDYGMTDGNYAQRLLHYGLRGGVSDGHPALMGIRVGGRGRGGREQSLRELEELGMAVFESTDEASNLRMEPIPDSASLSQAEIDALPEYVRYLKCGEQIENGDPCRAFKYTTWGCEKRAKQVKWHPGFKSHAMDGRALSLFLTDVLLETLVDLLGHTTTDPGALLDELRKEEDSLFQNLLKAELPENTELIYFPDAKQRLKAPFDVEAVWRGPSVCRTARLPSESRYLGLATNTEKVGRYVVMGNEQYDVGLALPEAQMPDAMNGTMKLTWDPKSDRERCNAILKPDYKDFFYTMGKHGQTKLTIPNAKEKEFYNYANMSLKGHIFLCLVTCNWGKCANGELRYADYSEGLFEITVNGEPIEEMHNIGFDVSILKSQAGFEWQPNENGEFIIGVKVKNPNDYLRISSIIIF